MPPSQALPTDIALDTQSQTDGPHRLLIRAQDEDGRKGVEEIPFVVHNRPGIVVSGLRPHSIRRGALRLARRSQCGCGLYRCSS